MLSVEVYFINLNYKILLLLNWVSPRAGWRLMIMGSRWREQQPPLRTRSLVVQAYL